MLTTSSIMDFKIVQAGLKWDTGKFGEIWVKWDTELGINNNL